MNDLGEQIRKLRESCFMTQSELEDKAGICSGAVGRYERGICMPKHAILVRLLDAMGCELVIRRKEK